MRISMKTPSCTILTSWSSVINGRATFASLNYKNRKELILKEKNCKISIVVIRKYFHRL